MLPCLNLIAQSKHCIAVETSRRLVADATRSYVQDTLLLAQGSRIVILQEQNQQLFNDFNERLAIANAKNKDLQEISFQEQALSESYRAESDYNRRRFQKQVVTKWGLFIGGLIIGAAGGYSANN